jgi:hypothetical protein
MYESQTLIDVPPGLLKAMKWKRAVPARIMVYFTPEYTDQSPTFGLLHSDHLELDHARQGTLTMVLTKPDVAIGSN